MNELMEMLQAIASMLIKYPALMLTLLVMIGCCYGYGNFELTEPKPKLRKRTKKSI